MTYGPRSSEGTTLVCSFCGKDGQRVHKILAGPGVYICNECIALCNEILEEESRPPK